MFLVPIIFFCNTALFAMLLEERFKLITTFSISASAFILSIIVNFISEGIITDSLLSEHVGNALCVLILFIVSVFISSNNLAQKLFVGLLLITNYAFITDFVPHLLASMPFGTSGIMAILIANLIYIIFSLITLTLFTRPLHYFFRRSISPSMIGLCLLQFLCWFTAKGAANDFFEIESFPFRFFLTLFIYIFVIFTFRSIYGGARYKARDIIMSTDNAIMTIEVDSFNTMLININALKTVKKNLDYQLDRIGALAEVGKTRDIAEYVNLSKQSTTLVPLLTDYNENQYISAIIATKTALAKSKGIQLENNISLGDMNVKLNEICVIINDLLSLAIIEAEKAGEEKHIRISVFPANQQLTVEAVYTEGKPVEKIIPLTSRTAFSFIENFFEVKEESDDDALRNIMDIIEKHSGKINISHSESTAIIRIGVNY